MGKKIIEWSDLGTIGYESALSLQESLRAKRQAGEIEDRVLLLEHPPVFTMGKKDCADDFISSLEEIKKDGIDIVKANRGGRVTFHGPGQLVCYFILDLISLGCGVKDFVTLVEDISIRVLDRFGVKGLRDAEHPGVWVGRNKIVAIGLNVSHDVTMHGLAMNVSCDLDVYRHVVACGVRGRSVTSLKKETGREIKIEDVKSSMIAEIGLALDRDMVEVKNL